MKRWIGAAMALVMTVMLTACGQSAGNVSTNSGSSSESESTRSSQSSAADTGSSESAVSESPASEGGILIAYFSVPETDSVDTVAGASRVVVGEVLGNNQYVAQLIQQEVGGDLFRIETVQEYPGTHDALLDFAYNELSFLLLS